MAKRLRNIELLLQKSSKVEIGLRVVSLNSSFRDSRVDGVLLSFFGSSFFVKKKTIGTGVAKYGGVTNADESVFLGFCSTLNGHILTFSGETGLKAHQKFLQQFMLVPEFEEFSSLVHLSSVQAFQVCLPTEKFATPESYLHALEQFVQSQQKSIPKLEIKESTLSIGGKAGNNSIQISALKSVLGTVDSVVLVLKAKGPIANKIGNLIVSNKQTSVVDVIAFHIMQTLNSLSSTGFLEILKNDLIKMYAVGSILLHQNSEKNLFSASGAYVAKSLKGVSNKLYSEHHSAEVQELIREWFALLVVNQQFIKNGDSFIKNLISVVQNPVKDSTPLEKPAQTIGRKSRKATKAVETTADPSQTS
jgi:hypothetical protein